MNTRSAGFTIIETVLFLGVSGMLAVGILAGSSIVISQQRYRDAGTTLQAFMQNQYTNVSNVENDRSDKLICNNNATIQEQEVSGPIAGASDCVVMGKLIQIDNNGQTIVSSNVIGRQVGNVTVTNDVDAIKQYTLAWTSAGQEQKQIDWGASLTYPAGQGADPIDSLNLLILRSPFSGVMRTFVTGDATLNNVQRTISPSAVNGFNPTLTLCLNSADLTVLQRLGLVVRAGATSPSAIELFTEGSGC